MALVRNQAYQKESGAHGNAAHHLRTRPVKRKLQVWRALVPRRTGHLPCVYVNVFFKNKKSGKNMSDGMVFGSGVRPILWLVPPIFLTIAAIPVPLSVLIRISAILARMHKLAFERLVVFGVFSKSLIYVEQKSRALWEDSKFASRPANLRARQCAPHIWVRASDFWTANGEPFHGVQLFWDAWVRFYRFFYLVRKHSKNTHESFKSELAHPHTIIYRAPSPGALMALVRNQAYQKESGAHGNAAHHLRTRPVKRKLQVWRALVPRRTGHLPCVYVNVFFKNKKSGKNMSDGMVFGSGVRPILWLVPPIFLTIAAIPVPLSVLIRISAILARMHKLAFERLVVFWVFSKSQIYM